MLFCIIPAPENHFLDCKHLKLLLQLLNYLIIWQNLQLFILNTIKARAQNDFTWFFTFENCTWLKGKKIIPNSPQLVQSYTDNLLALVYELAKNLLAIWETN